jgi:N-glycosylase/DNA lyase
MHYIKEQNKITILNLEHFNIEHILACGQVFLFEKVEENYEVVSGCEFARIVTGENKVEIFCTNADYFEHYFDLKTNYAIVKQNLSQHPVLMKAINYGYGMRILRQPPLETTIGFIFSANNNVGRIQASMLKLKQQFGTKMESAIGSYYAFPTLEQLKKITKEQFLALGAGYRASYLTETIKNYFTKLKGIGSKVADCILLFAYYKTEVVPVDIWVEKVYQKYFRQNNQIKSREQIRTYFLNIFTKYAGYAQQYLFYYEREVGKLKKVTEIT